MIRGRGRPTCPPAWPTVGTSLRIWPQLPVKTKAADPEGGEWMLLRADSASCTHEFVQALRDRGVEYSIGFPLTEELTKALVAVDESAWQPCITQDCEEREGGECA